MVTPLYSPSTGTVIDLTAPQVTLSGEAPPTQNIGADNDIYIQFDSGTNRELNFYFKYPDLGWVKLLGVAIPPDRIVVTFRYGNTPPPAVGGQNGDIYSYLDNTIPRSYKIYTYEGTAWNLGATLLIPSTYYGANAPTGMGINGDVFIQTNDSYPKQFVLWAWDETNADWEIKRQITTPSPPTTYYGANAPTETGINGDIFIQTKDSYPKQFILWAWDENNTDWEIERQITIPEPSGGGAQTHIHWSTDPFVNQTTGVVPPDNLGSNGDVCFTYHFPGLDSNTNLQAMFGVYTKANNVWVRNLQYRNDMGTYEDPDEGTVTW